MAASLRPQCSKQIFERKNIQNGNPRDNSDFLTTRGMGVIAGFQRRLFPHSNSHRVPEVSQVPFPKAILPVPGPPLWPINSSDGVHLCGQRGQVNGSVQGYRCRIHQYLDDWLIRAPTKESCHQGTQSLLTLCQELGWVVNLQKSELEPKQTFEFLGYRYDLSQGLVQPTQNRWESIIQKVESVLSKPTCRVRKFMSLIGLLTATEKQVLVATDNTTVVAYINKEGGMRSGSLCALLWRLCWCNLRQVVLKARHIPGHLNVIADKLSHQGHIIQTE